MHFRDLTEKDIDVRIGQVGVYPSGDGYVMLLLYKDARVDMDILDETVGSENWQRKHYEVKGNMYCSVGINCGKTEQSEWVWKDDCGTESNTEKEKGEASDAFKRVCVNWGIGRELYTAPPISVKCEVEEVKGKKVVKNLSRFEVTHIKIENKVITELTILAYDKNERVNKEVFVYSRKVYTAERNNTEGTQQPKAPIRQAYDNTPPPPPPPSEEHGNGADAEKSIRTRQLEHLIAGTKHTLDEANDFALKVYGIKHYDELTQRQYNNLYDRLETKIKQERGNG
ncbi:MAG: hypothetical protein J1G01_04435 [Clostridiales bacterium]|nr:hypothetical protein [Clostridiales bacterium]